MKRKTKSTTSQGKFGTSSMTFDGGTISKSGILPNASCKLEAQNTA